MGHKPVRVNDRRTVDIDLSGPPLDRRPVLTTPAGKVPIAVSRVEIGYDLESGALRWCTAWGDLIDEKDIEKARAGRRGFGSFSSTRRRRIAIDYWGTDEPRYAPDWLLNLIEQHRPISALYLRAKVNEIADEMERVLGLTEITPWSSEARQLVRKASAELDVLGRDRKGSER